MAKLKQISDGTLIPATTWPQWNGGVWDCGNVRIPDSDGTHYVPVSDQQQYQVMAAMQYYMSFTGAERIAIKGSTDPQVVEMWATLQLALQNKSNVDPNLPSVQQALNYLATPTSATPAGPGILAASRVQQILNGVAQ